MAYLSFAIGIIFILLALISFWYARRQAASSRIFLIHSLTPRPLDVGAISPRQFSELLDSITSAGLTCGTIEECMRDQTKVAITFDDGYDDLMQLIPLLRQNHLPVTVFIPTAYVGKSNDWDNFLSRGMRSHLSAQQIRELASLGVRFGSHGHTHRDLTTVSIATARAELALSRKLLSDLTGREVTDLAFPFGRSNHLLCQSVIELGFARMFGSVPMNLDSPVIGRFPITRLDNAISLRAKLTGNSLAAIEVLKALTVNRFSHLTPVVRR